MSVVGIGVYPAFDIGMFMEERRMSAVDDGRQATRFGEAKYAVAIKTHRSKRTV
jgi:hypothetical protein